MHHLKIYRGLFALIVMGSICLFGLSIFSSFSHQRIEKNKMAYHTSQLSQALPEGQYNNFLNTKQTIDDMSIYHACNENKDTYLLVELTTEKAYNGRIELLFVLDIDQQRIVHIRPLFHQETPGLGDKIDIDKSPWLSQFAQPFDSKIVNFTLREDGGHVDAITGATITSRAVTQTLRRILETQWPSPDCKQSDEKKNQRQMGDA